MMQNLLIEEGSLLSITNVSLPKATYVKLQPQHVDFLEISNPRAVLEHALRNFSCVTKGDVIQLPFCNKNYHFELKEVKPQDAACIIETDCNVDFDAPVGYKEPGTNDAAAAATTRGGSGYNNNNRNSQNSSVTTGGNSNVNDNIANDALGATLANIPKQSAFANKNNSGRSSPALSSISATSTSAANYKTNNHNNNEQESLSSSSIRIVNGKIVRPDHHNDNDIQYDNNNTTITNQPYIPEHSISSIIANQTGSTGVQRNSAIATSAPQVDYWAVNAGDGARLDGKKSVLKDKDGNEIDVRKLRAEAAAKRLAVVNSNSSSGNKNGIMPSSGQMVNGTVVVDDDVNDNTSAAAAGATNAAASKRKSRIGSKYSKLKQSGAMAFQGSANTFKK
jgi:hypothetical protein